MTDRIIEPESPLPLAPPDDSGERLRPCIGLTIGDPNGVGPEVVLKCLADSRLRRFVDPVVIGSRSVLQAHADALGLTDVELVAVDDPREDVGDGRLGVIEVGEAAPEVTFGTITREGGLLAMQAVERAVDLCMDGSLDAMVTAPISKEAISRAGYHFPGHTEFIAQRTNAAMHTMMMVSGKLRVGLVTGHIPIWDVPKAVTEEAILQKVRMIHESLVRDFGCTRPRIAVLGLNPHAGDGGVLGREEIDVILPAVKQANDEGYLVSGPYPADGFFAIGGYRIYDAVLAMYHDQGLVPFKTLAFNSGVNFTAGLSIVRTSPDHGTAYDIAGKGKANEESIRAAVYTAIDVARRRAALKGPSA